MKLVGAAFGVSSVFVLDKRFKSKDANSKLT